MSERRKYRVQASATINTYVYCRVAARDALKIARREEDGCFYFRMMAGVFAAFTVEAFFNHVGHRKVKDWAVFEKRLGPREKLLLLCQLLHLSGDPHVRPFQTLRDMLRLRDALAHGKTETVTSDLVVSDPRDSGARYPAPGWHKLCSLTSVSRMVEDAEAMVCQLHSQLHWHGEPFDSPGHGSAGVIEIE